MFVDLGCTSRFISLQTIPCLIFLSWGSNCHSFDIQLIIVFLIKNYIFALRSILHLILRYVICY